MRDTTIIVVTKTEYFLLGCDILQNDCKLLQEFKKLTDFSQIHKLYTVTNTELNPDREHVQTDLNPGPVEKCNHDIGLLIQSITVDECFIRK